MKIFLIIILLLSINQCQSQIEENTINQCQSQIEESNLTDKFWGEINDKIPKHRGKAGLIIMKLDSNHTFQAYESTDFGAAVLQSGKWSLKNDKILFDILKTENYAEHTTMKGKILSRKEIGKIEYQVIELTNEKLILFNKKYVKKFIFKISKYKYGIK